MRGRYPMSEQDRHKVAGTPAPAASRARVSLAGLLAFLGVLVLAGTDLCTWPEREVLDDDILEGSCPHQ
jgi:hypothetical protein